MKGKRHRTHTPFTTRERNRGTKKSGSRADCHLSKSVFPPPLYLTGGGPRLERPVTALVRFAADPRLRGPAQVARVTRFRPRAFRSVLFLSWIENELNFRRSAARFCPSPLLPPLSSTRWIPRSDARVFRGYDTLRRHLPGTTQPMDVPLRQVGLVNIALSPSSLI